MPSGANGKADSFTTIRGSDIPSAYADPNKSYILSRNIANLSTVGALDSVEAPLAKRIDGIIANMPADGQLSLPELVRMENPTIHASLFPEEQAALPTLWKLVEAPDPNDTVHGPKDNFGVFDDSTPPAAAVPPSSLAISSLATELQAPATRLENLYNSDNDATTVTLADLAQGVANPASFTPTEVTAFGTIQAVFRTKAVAQSDAKIVLSPGPGQTAVDATLGPAAFHMVGATKVDETRTVYESQFNVTFVATQTLSSTVTLPTGVQLLVINQDTGGETVITTGTVPNLGRGVYVFEAWSNGQRSFSTNAELPTMTAQTQISLADKLDYTLVSGLQPLVRNLNSSSAMYNGYYVYTVHYTYDPMTIPPPSGQSQQAVAAVASPTLTIPVGRYSLAQAGANVKLLVYPNNAVWFNNYGTLTRLVPVGNSGGAINRLMAPNNGNITFDASANQFYCGQCNPVISVRLDASMRDI